jgi:histidyl-tRNA synthetase
MPEDPYRAPKGVHDVLPPDSTRWVDLVATFAGRARRAGFGLIVTPIFEYLEVFERVGTSTDVVKKEMYAFVDKGGRTLALRPEGTAGVVRAFVQHRPPLPWKVWYVAPNFRYERPQKGRYRQHWQLGVEVLGPEDTDLDVEVIALAYHFYADLGLTRARLLVNSMGDAESRAAYLVELRTYFLDHGDVLGDEGRRRVEENPLRVLDAKRDDWSDLIERAPQITAHLSDASQAHFEGVQHGLDVLGIDYELAPRLVRGFDYYTSTAFEFASDALDATQNAIGGGGRYDRLAEEMGGPPTPGIGFGIGIERLLDALDAEGASPRRAGAPEAFVVDGLGGDAALVLVEELRGFGVATDRAYGGRSMKAQLKAADKSNARFAVVLAPDEIARNAVAVKDLSTGKQVEVPRDSVAGWIRQRVEQP